MIQPNYQRGNVSLYLGDCMDILPELGKVDAVVTDPPYGIGKSIAGIRKDQKNSKGDYATEFEDTPEYVEKTVVVAIETCIKISNCVAVTPGFKCLNLYPKPSHIGGFYYQGQSTVTAWGAAWWQPILFYGKDPRNGELARDMLIGKPNHNSEQNGHPCPKELTTWQKLTERMSHEAQTILDPFMGSGTTGVACVRLGRGFVGIEKEPKYFEIACKRIDEEFDKLVMFEPVPKAVRQREMFEVV